MKFRLSRGETIGTSQNSFGVGVFTTVPPEAWKSAIWACMPRRYRANQRVRRVRREDEQMRVLGDRRVLGKCQVMPVVEGIRQQVGIDQCLARGWIRPPPGRP